jgi:hypothetical protein
MQNKTEVTVSNCIITKLELENCFCIWRTFLKMVRTMNLYINGLSHKRK